MEYIKSPDKKTDYCLFCEKRRSSNDKDNLLLYRSSHSFVVMNPYPYNNGHLMVLPNLHVPSLDGMEDNALLDFVKVTRFALTVLNKALAPEGFNTGLNLGKVAGAGLGEHLHLHVVPRWNGDASFMTVIGEIRVIPEHIASTYDMLYPLFNSGGRGD